MNFLHVTMSRFIYNQEENMIHRYLVLGGGVGKAIVHDLARQHDTDKVTICDKDSRYVFGIDKFIDKASKQKCQYVVADLKDLDTVKLFKDFDVVISALPAVYNFDLAKAAIEAGVHFCDLGGVVSVTLRQTSLLNKLASEKKVSVIPDCGLMPGLGVILSKKLLSEFDITSSITIYVGGLPQKPRPPLNYQRVFNMEGLASICYEYSPVLILGNIEHLEPFAEKEIFSVSELERFSKKFNGRIEAFVTAGASISPWTFKKMGVQNFSEKTVRWPGFLKFVKSIPRERFEEEVLPHINIPVTTDDPDLVWMKVEAIGYKDKEIKTKTYSLLDLFDTKTGLSAMERSTGFPTAVIARMLAKGQSIPGVNTPETAFTKEQFSYLWKKLNEYFDIKRS